jgi:hypothetical protein
MEAICLCGSQRGYPHGWDCPWPNFNGCERRDFDWLQDRDRLRESYRKAGRATHGLCGWQYGQKAARLL